MARNASLEMRTAGALRILLLVLLVAGTASAAEGGTAGTEPRAAASIMIPAAEFIPTTDNWDYSNYGLFMTATNSSNFSVAIPFAASVVNVQKLTLYVNDNTPGASVCVTLYRARPAEFAEDNAGAVCSLDNATGQAISTTAINPGWVNTANRAFYLWANISGPGVSFYGVKVTYTY